MAGASLSADDALVSAFQALHEQGQVVGQPLRANLAVWRFQSRQKQSIVFEDGIRSEKIVAVESHSQLQ